MSVSPLARVLQVPIAPVVSSVGRYSIGLDMRTTGSLVPGSVGWPAARRVIYVPLYLPIGATIVQWWWLNGGAVAGDVDVGLFTSENGLPGTKLSSSGTTTPTPISVVQAVTLGTPYSVPPGSYFLAAFATSGSFGMMRSAFNTFTTMHKAFGMCIETLGAGTALPTTATPVTVGTQNYLPVFGFATVPVI
jgi:hypothetical protein